MAAPERTVVIRPRTVLSVLGLALLLAVVLWVAWAARGVIAWIVIAAFLAMALNPAVDFFERRRLRRAYAAVLVFVLALVALGGLSYLLIPPIVSQVTDFSKAIPDIVDDLTRGRGALGFLQRDYQIVDRIREAVEGDGLASVLGFTEAGLSFARSVVTVVVGAVTIAFLTLFLLLDGRRLVHGFLDLMPERSRQRWERVGQGVYRTVGGYVTGNILISVIAGVVSTPVIYGLGIPYAVSLGVVVALFDLVPLAGATIAALVVVLVAVATKGWVIALAVGIFLLVYQQFENHVLQPLIYGRTVSISPVVVLVAVLIGANLAGVLGALGAIPVAGTLQVIGRELLEARRERGVAGADPGPPT